MILKNIDNPLIKKIHNNLTKFGYIKVSNLIKKKICKSTPLSVKANS